MKAKRLSRQVSQAKIHMATEGAGILAYVATLPTLRYFARALCLSKMPGTWLTYKEERSWLPREARVWYGHGAAPTGGLACFTALPFTRLPKLREAGVSLLLLPSYMPLPDGVECLTLPETSHLWQTASEDVPA